MDGLKNEFTKPDRTLYSNVKSGKYESNKSGIRDVWIVTVTDEITNAISTYFFDKSNRRLWKQDISIDDRKMSTQTVPSTKDPFHVS